MQFKIRDKDTNEEYGVYSVQMAMTQSALGQPTPVVMFLIFNHKDKCWELAEASRFVPCEETKSAIL